MSVTKNFVRTKDTHHLKATMDSLGWSPSRLAEELGVSPSTVTGWIGKGDAPYMSLIACRALRKTASLPKVRILTVIIDNDANLTAIEAILKAMELQYTFQYVEPKEL